MSLVVTALHLAKQAFLNVAVALIIVFLPFEVLFRLSSWILFMPALDMVTEVAMMILLLALVSGSLALLVAGVGCALVSLPFRISVQKIEDAVRAVAAIGPLAIIVFVLLNSLQRWLLLVTGFDIRVAAANLTIQTFLSVIAILLAWAWKYGFVAAGNVIQSRLAKGSRGVLVLIASAGLVVGVNGITLHDYREIKPNPIPTSRAGMPNVILLSIDCLTAEDMSLYGYHLPTTPKLEAFAKKSYVFDNFFSSSNWTLPTVASFISGLYPITSGVSAINSYFLKDDRKKNLAQAMTDQGYQTVAVVANIYGHPLFEWISDSFSAVTEVPVPGRIAGEGLIYRKLKNYRTRYWLKETAPIVDEALNVFRGFSERGSRGESYPLPAEGAFDRTTPFLTSLKQPNFVWTHILPPHAPYLPAAPFKYRFGNFKDQTLEVLPGEYSPEQQNQVDTQRLRFDEFILDTDSRIGVFLDKLRAIGRFDDSIIVITADHGESFTKNFLGHGGLYLHQPLIHIPLIIHLPGQKEGKRIPFYAGQVDLLPTIMDLVDLPIPKWAQGESLKDAMLQGKPTSMPKFSMSLDQDSRFVPPSKGTVAVMQDGWKLVRYLATGKEEFYNLASDPRETTDLAISYPERAKTMRRLIYARFKLTK